MLRTWFLVLLGSWFYVGASGASGQAPGERAIEDIEEITVTAQRRNESIQDVPFSMNAVSESDIDSFAIEDMDSVTMLMSGVVLNKFFGFGMPFIRGIGSTIQGAGSEPSAALYIDGVYQPRATLYLPDLSDVQSVQVLKGAQSSLYGRNATAGAIIVQTKNPRPGLDSDLNVTYGNGNRLVTKGYISGGSDRVSGSLAAYRLSSDGFYENLATGDDNVDRQDEWAARGKLLFSIGEASEFLLSVAHYENNGPNGKFFSQLGTNNVLASIFPGAQWTSKDHKTYADQQGRTIKSIAEEDTSITATWKTSFDGFDVSVVGGYIDEQDKGGLDPDASTAQILWFGNSNQQGTPGSGEQNNVRSIETVVTSNGSGPFEWIVGGVYEENRVPYNVLIDAFAAGGFITSGTMGDQAASAFVDLGYSFGADDRWKVNAAVRYIDEEKKVAHAQMVVFPTGVENGAPNPPIPLPSADKSWTKPVYTSTITYRVLDPVNAYVRFAQGFRSGSFSHTNPTADPVDPETVDAYAFGVKSEFMDGRVTANSEVFYNKISDLQVQVFDANNGAFTKNAAAGESQGIDAHLGFSSVSRQFSVALDMTYLKTEFTKFDNPVLFIPCPNLGIDFPMNCVPGDPTSPAANISPPPVTGNDLVRSPEFTGSLSAQYMLPTSYGTWEFAAVSSYSSKYYFDPNNRLEQDPLTLVNGTVTFRPTRYEGLYLTGWVTNATDEKYHDTIEPIQFGDFAHSADPRMYGLTVGYSFSRE